MPLNPFCFRPSLRALPVLFVLAAQFLEETPGDEDLEQALEENKLVLVKKRHRIKALRNAVSDLRAQRPHLATTAASLPRTASGGGADAESGDTISTMAASMDLNAAAPAPSPPSDVAGDNESAGIDPAAAAAAAAPDATAPVGNGREGGAAGIASTAGEDDFGGDGRGGVLL